MKFKLIKIKQLSGQKTKIYSILLENESKSLFDRFLEENIEKYKPELQWDNNFEDFIGNLTFDD